MLQKHLKTLRFLHTPAYYPGLSCYAIQQTFENSCGKVVAKLLQVLKANVLVFSHQTT